MLNIYYSFTHSFLEIHSNVVMLHDYFFDWQICTKIFREANVFSTLL